MREVLFDAARGIRAAAIAAISEDEIVSALGALARMGMYVEPTSAAAAAGLSPAARSREPSRRTRRSVLVLTGSGLKASEKIGQLLNLKSRTD